MARDELSVLSAFMAVAEERSFTRAAKQLNISTSGLSHAIRRLEEQIGVRLLTRTTRSVSPTDAGEQLLAHLQPALTDIRETLSKLFGLQAKPMGRVRLLCPRVAAKSVLAPKPVSSREITRTCSSKSRPMTVVSTSCQPVSTPASNSASPLRRIWWPFASRRIFDQRLLPHRGISRHTPSRQPPETCFNINASASVTAVKQVPMGIR